MPRVALVVLAQFDCHCGLHSVFNRSCHLRPRFLLSLVYASISLEIGTNSPVILLLMVGVR